MTYRRWFPGSWTGEPSAADANFRYPMIYTPTDTTQLGYTYQRVPVWQRRAGMIPPVPHPDEWHTPDCGVQCNGVVDAGACGYQGGYASDISSQGDIYTNDSVISAPQYAQPVPEYSHEASPEPYMPAPAQGSDHALPPAEPGLNPIVPVPEAPGIAPPPPASPRTSNLGPSAAAPLLVPIPYQ